MIPNPRVSVSRDDGEVTTIVSLGFVTSMELDRGVVRWFHDGAPRETQIKGFGYKSRNEAARKLASVRQAQRESEVDGG